MYVSVQRKSYIRPNFWEFIKVKILILIFLTIPFILLGQQDTVPKTNLHLAVLQGNVDAVRQHINAGSDLNQKDQFGSTPLVVAITFGKTEVAKALIDAGADLKIGDNYGSTPLHLAAFFCRKEIVKSLLDKGADKYIRNINGSTPYDIAASSFELDKEKYDQLNAALGQLGFKLDNDEVKKTRPEIAEMLKSSIEELKKIDCTPLTRDDWEISTPTEQGLDPMLFANLYNDANHLETLYSLLVIKNGCLIAENYFNGASVEQLSKRASVTKSYISAMLGIALDEGYIKSLDEKMIEYFPEVEERIKDQRKKSITLRQMLQMRAGYPWEETDTTYWNAIWSGEYISKIKDIPLTKDPGSEFQYSNLTSNWLGIIISKASGMDLKSFGKQYLFNPLDVKLGGWLRDMDGYYIGSGDIEFTARDMAKFGLLYLNNGKYKGEQIIPATWVNESLQRYSKDINSAGIESSRVGRYFYDIGYGYQWWSASVGKHHFNLAWGHGGQFIILLHDLNMVIVVTSDPFWGKQKHFNAWTYEKSTLNVIGKFIKNLPTTSNKID